MLSFIFLKKIFTNLVYMKYLDIIYIHDSNSDT